MHIIIVGAGIGGLSAALALALAGHKITLVESATQLAEVGAGVQLTPSATKWFWKWGLGPDILAEAVLPSWFIIHDSESGELLGKADFGNLTEQYGGPYLVIHRADIHRILHGHVVKAGITVRLNSRVTRYEMEGGGIELHDGTTLYADLVVAADGINSKGRRQLTGMTNEGDTGLRRAGYAAFRTMADVSKVRSVPATAQYVAHQNCNCVVGKDAAIMTYMIKGNEKLNVVLSHRDEVDTTDWTQDQYRTEIRKLFANFNDSAKALIETALTDSSQTIANWPISEVKPLDCWTSKSGKFVLIGDAAHAMTFFLSMGVSLAVEDAAALTESLSLYEEAGGKGDLAQAMQVFESVRRTHTPIVGRASLRVGHVLHSASSQDRIAVGEASRIKDASVLDGCDYEEKQYLFPTINISYGVTDPRVREFLYGHDPKAAIRAEWTKVVS